MGISQTAYPASRRALRWCGRVGGVSCTGNQPGPTARTGHDRDTANRHDQARPARADRQIGRRERDADGDGAARAGTRLDLHRADQARRRCARHFGARARRRRGRDGGGARAEPRGLQGPGPRVQRQGRRPFVDAARRRPLYRARRRDAGLRVLPGQLHQPRPVAHPGRARRADPLLQRARRRARAVPAEQLQRLSPLDLGLRRQAAALQDHPGRLLRPRRRAAGQGRASECAERCGDRRGCRDPARIAALVGRARQQHALREKQRFRRPAWLAEGARAGG
jgi:hypothetical protein